MGHPGGQLTHRRHFAGLNQLGLGLPEFSQSLGDLGVIIGSPQGTGQVIAEHLNHPLHTRRKIDLLTKK